MIRMRRASSQVRRFHVQKSRRSAVPGDHSGVLFAAGVLSACFLGVSPTAQADDYCFLGNLLVPQEVHHVGTYRDATCAMVADLVLTSDDSSCLQAVADYVVSRGYDPYVGKDIAIHNC